MPHPRLFTPAAGVAAVVAAGVAAAVVAVAAFGLASLPPDGYFVDSVQAAEARPTWRDAPDGDFTYSIRREIPGPLEARLLGIAESCYPPRAMLVALAVGGNREVGSDSANAALWWCDGTGIRRVPYAVTAGALWYYLELTENLREPGVRVPGAPALFRAHFAYRGSIASRDMVRAGGREFQQVYVARMKLDWSYDDGTFAPSVLAHRTVVLSGGGDVLFIEGDGQAVERVALSDHRGVGRVERRVR